MQEHRKLKARILSLIQSVAMVTTMLPATTLASTNDDIAPGASSVGKVYPAAPTATAFSRVTANGTSGTTTELTLIFDKDITGKDFKALQKDMQRLKLENEILKKSDHHIRKRTIIELVTFIQNNLKYYTVIQLCGALNFPKSTYYKALVCVPSNRQKEYETK